MKVKVKLLSHVRFFATQWTVAYQAPLYMGFSRQEYWSGLSFPPPGDLPNSGIELHILSLLYWQADSLPLSHLGSPKYLIQGVYYHILYKNKILKATYIHNE